MAELPAVREAACFFEVDTSLHVLRRSFVEAVGTCLLTVAMVGSGLAVEPKLAHEPIAASLVIALSIAGALVGLIIALGKVSGGHYNPLITIGQWLRGERSTACTLSYVVAQVSGSVVGSTIAMTMFATAAVRVGNGMPSFGLVMSEFVATTGLLIIVIGCGRSGKWDTGPFAVGAWLTAAILATPSSSYANPAVTISAIFAGGPVALTVYSALSYVAAQIVGLLTAILITKFAFEQNRRGAATGIAIGG